MATLRLVKKGNNLMKNNITLLVLRLARENFILQYLLFGISWPGAGQLSSIDYQVKSKYFQCCNFSRFSETFSQLCVCHLVYRLIFELTSIYTYRFCNQICQTR